LVIISDVGKIVTDRLAVAVCCGVPESFTVIVTLAFVTAVVGVPVIAPVVALIDSPAGSPLADQI